MAAKFGRRAGQSRPARRQRILDCSEDDCCAMRVLLDALRGLPMRP